MKNIVQEIFSLSNSADNRSNGHSLPDFFATNFAQALQDGTTISITDFATAYNNSLLTTPPSPINDNALKDALSVSYITQHVEIITRAEWKPNESTPGDSQVYTLAAHASLYYNGESSIESVVLRYPTSEGTASKEFVPVSESGQTYYVIRPWYSEDQQEPSENLFITDFVSGGTATIEVSLADGSTYTESREIYKYDLGELIWTYPLGQRSRDHNFEVSQIDAGGEDSIRPVLTWKQTRPILPAGFDLEYEVELMFSISTQQGVDLPEKPSDLLSNLFSSDDDWAYTYESEYGAYASATIFASWQEDRRILSQKLRIEDELEVIGNLGQGITGYYESRVTPVLVKRSTSERIQEGVQTGARFTVSNKEAWSVTLNGTITFPSQEALLNHMPRDEQSNALPGSWKIGVFEAVTFDEVNFDSVHIFDSATPQSFAPVSSGSITLLEDLGSFDTIYATSTQSTEVNYEFSAFNRDNSPIERKKGYQLIVWYDLDDKPAEGDDFANEWENTTSAVANQIDFGGSDESLAKGFAHPIEWISSGSGHHELKLRFDGLYLLEDSAEYGRHETNIIFDTGGQTFDIELAPWLDQD